VIPWRLLAAVLLVLVPTACLHPRGTPQRPAITGFDIEGASKVSADELRDRLATQASGRWLWQDAQYLDQDAFANDQRRIVRYYQTRGYYDAKVISADVVPDGEGAIKIKVRVSEGQPVRVAAIEMSGLEGAPEARARLKRLPLATGDVFTETAYDAMRAAILDALTRTGWAKAEVAQHAEVDPARHEVRVRYTVQPGQRYKFGGVEVAGAAKIPRARIREEAQLVVQPGATYDSSDLPKAQARVFDLGVFGGVRVGTREPDPARGTVPVVVSVREAPFRTVRAGPGFLIQATRYELDAMAGWSHRNWLGGLRKLNLDARAGYAWLPNWFAPQKHGLVGLLSADFTQPGVLTRSVDFNVRMEAERGVEQAYDFWAERLRLGTPVRFGRLASIIPSINLELYQLTGSLSQANSATGTVLFLQTCPGRDPSLCLLSFFEQRVTLDFRDDPILTTKGAYFSIALQEGFSAFGLGSSYLRILPEVRVFASLPYKLVLAGRARIGIANPLAGGDVPIVAKFTSGGPSLMRGYYTRALSPVILYDACTATNPSAKPCPRYLPVGGNGLFDGSAEVRFPIAGSLGGAVFLDFGNVTNRVAEALDLRNLQYAVGAGLRYMTIFGPLRLDIAGRLPRPGGDQPGVQVQRLDQPLNQPTNVVGVHHEPIVSVHVSIGEAF
jgi:translocation and assembly module TamA